MALNQQQMALQQQQIQALQAQRRLQMDREIQANLEVARNQRDPALEGMQRRNLELNVDRNIESTNSVFRRAVGNVRHNLADVLEDIPPDENGKPLTQEKALVMLNDMQQEFEKHSRQVRQEILALHQRGPNGAPPDHRWQQQQMNDINTAHSLALQKTFRDRYGAHGEALYARVAEEGHSLQQGPLGQAFSKIGTVGGLIGAVAGGALAFFGLGGMGGGFLSLIGTAVAALAGGVLGGTINNWIADSNKKKSNTPEPAAQNTTNGEDPTKKKTAGPEQNKEEELTTGDLKPAQGIPAPPKSTARNIPH